jgi:predicted MFS family arabinose efflux permease
VIYSVRNRAALMRRAGPQEQGAVMATRYSAAQASQVLGLGLGGLVATAAGARASFVVAGLGMIVVGGLFSAHLLRRPDDVTVVSPEP